MSADVVGYSRMMANDELGTFELWLATLHFIEAMVWSEGGRLVDAPGDNVLAEFACEEDALQCALQIQHGLARKQLHSAAERQLRLRIGVHTGEILALQGRLYGTTVNMAARLQQVADPSSVMVSEAVAERVSPALQHRLYPLGKLRFKNIPQAVETLRACVGE